MRIAVVGGDLRFAYLAKLLAERGYEARGVLLESARVTGMPEGDMRWLGGADLAVMGWPPRAPLSEIRPAAADLLEACPGRFAFCGPAAFDGALAEDRVAADLSAREAFLLENAWLTAEGAIHAAMGELDRTLYGSACAVVGYGRIGRALSQLLWNMGARVVVVSRNPSVPEGEGFRAVRTCRAAEAMFGCDAVFSTPPHRVLDESALRALPKGAVVLDLASSPYGFDLEMALLLGLRARREGGLPGRYCPRSAAETILGFLEEVILREG